jgi:hypothetical protein
MVMGATNRSRMVLRHTPLSTPMTMVMAGKNQIGISSRLHFPCLPAK